MEQLEYFADTYFHQDWDLDAAGPLELVHKFRDDEPPEDVDDFAREIRETLKASPDEEELGHIWTAVCVNWDPTLDGWATYRAWFEAMLQVVG